MTVSDWVTVLTAAGAVLAAMGGGAKWSLGYIDGKAAAAEARNTAARVAMEAREAQARADLQRMLEERISELTEELSKVTRRESIYLKRALQLEAYIQGQKGLRLPELEGWPPV